MKGLKSNMDRFIVLDFDKNGKLLESLKSNMDRFIVAFILVNITSKIQFKIQYG